jgi:hypothetical protein
MLFMYLKITINALFLILSLHFSMKYQYKRSITVAIIYTLYIIFIAPYTTLYYSYLFLCQMIWLLALASYFQRSKYEYKQ